MAPVIKVCGIQNPEEALGAVAAGANTIGMLLGVPDYVEDKITPGEAKRIVEALPDGIRTVMVTHLPERDEIIRIAEYTGVTTIQIHDDMSPEDMKRLREKLPEIEIIKTVHVRCEDAVKKAKEYEAFCDMILLDTMSGNRIGGTGETHDWNISKEIVDELNIPVILAGGLTPGNIGDAIRKVKPAGIDANSGLEDDDGAKDFDKIWVFAEAGRMISDYL